MKLSCPVRLDYYRRRISPPNHGDLKLPLPKIIRRVWLCSNAHSCPEYSRVTLNIVTLQSKVVCLEVKMRGGKRAGAGRKKRPDHLRRELVTIRLPQWMISQLKNKGEIGYLIEYQLAKKDFLDLPDDYEIGS
jgi:hypothetical protein